MNKNDLAERVDLPFSTAIRCFEAIEDAFTGELARGGEVRILGSAPSRWRRARCKVRFAPAKGRAQRAGSYFTF